MLSKEEVDSICDALENEGVDYRLESEYGARGAYGRKCPAFVVSEPEAVHRAAARAGLDVDLSTDNMGLDYVVY